MAAPLVVVALEELQEQVLEQLRFQLQTLVVPVVLVAQLTAAQQAQQAQVLLAATAAQVQDFEV
jgi:glutamate racemase